MQRNLQLLSQKKYDLIVVGGGIFGVCAAWEASARELSVAIIDRADFCSATSDNHFRMIHGGIRYLQHGDLARVRESSKERSALLRIAPHLVQPLPIVIPTYGHDLKGKEILAAGVKMYDMLTPDRNQNIPDPERHIPPGSIRSRQDTLSAFPDLPARGLTGSVMFYDGQVYNPSRLALSFLQSAVQAGADAANYVEVTNFLQQGSRVVGVHACDHLTGDSFDIHAKAVINAAGPWALHLLQPSLESRQRSQPTFSRDACFVINRNILGRQALTVLGQTRDPDAIISRGNRHLFIVPWQDSTLIGVWHVVYTGSPDEIQVTEEELRAFLAEVNLAYPSLNIDLADISRWMAGLVLFGNSQVGDVHLRYGKRSQIIDHAATDGIEGLVTLLGVRYTTARGVAERAIDLAFRKIGFPPPPSKTACTSISGGEIENFAEMRDQARRQHPTIAAEPMESILHNHGSNYPRLLRLLEEDPDWANPIGQSRTIKAEVVHAVRHEMAQTLSDVVVRRTNLAAACLPADDDLHECARLMSAERDWSPDRIRKEIENTKRTFRSVEEVVR